MLHTLKKGEYPEGHRYWSNATADLTAPDGRDIGPEELPVQLRRVLDDLWSDGYGVECYLVELARGRAEELGAERPDLHVVFAEDVDQWKANDPFTEIWVVMPWDVDADAFHEVADWLDSRCRFNE